ncbi:Uma2 family endonuclease [Nocardiopsis exhalans]|uniref:Uma2 family endonuclease n=1 Tax=Nocardiopsis exhalans TaxID=163604 RepID=A0ABY5D7S4_9ACTN|nr:Uma2 family endonuclease [Nocardiopsis exhalans]USY19283.1 Uma2 family endonuclease [Nocardiopsis exhalans]
MTDENPGELTPESSHWEVVLRAWEELDLPEGWRAEIIEGVIHISSPFEDEHRRTLSLVEETLSAESVGQGTHEHGFQFLRAPAIQLPNIHSVHRPDLLVTNEDGDPLLAVEVATESTAHQERGWKIGAYANARVPVYLLIDRWDGEFTNAGVYWFSDPGDGYFRRLTKVPFGDTLHLPEPFDLTLDTGEFPA